MPASDLIPVPLAEKTREETTWVSEEGPDADLGLARNAAPYYALDMVRADAIINEVTAALSRLRDIARRLRMSASDIALRATAIQDTA